MARTRLLPALRASIALSALSALSLLAASAQPSLAQSGTAAPAGAASSTTPAPPATSASPVTAVPSAVATTAAPVAASPTTAAPAAAPVPDDDWIRPEDISDRADQLSRRLETRLASEDARAAIRKVEEGMARLDNELAAAFAQSRVALSGNDATSLLTLQDARRELEGTAAPFTAWKNQLDIEARRIAEVLAEAERARQRWARTLARPETTEAGDVTRRRVESSLAQIDDAIRNLTDWRAKVFALSDRLLDRSTAVSSTLESLEAATISRSASVLVPDNSPIWRRDLATQLGDELPLVPTRLREFARSTSEYVQTDSRPFVLQFLLWIGLLVAMRGLPEGSRLRLETAHVTPESLRLLARPYAIAGLLVLALSPVMHPTAPHRVMQILGLLALIPVARILTHASERTSPSLFIGLFALLLLERFSMALVTLPAVTLLLFLVQLAIAASVAIEYRRRVLASAGNRWIVDALTAAMAGVGVTIVAEAGGWSALATLLGRGILISTTAALYAYAITISLEALFAYGLASPTLRASRFVDRNQALLQRWASMALRLGGFLYWLQLVVNALGIGELVSGAVDSVLTAGLSVGALSISIGGVLAFVLTLVLAMMLSRLIRELLEDEVFPRMTLPRGIPNALLSLTSYAIWSLGFLLALAAAGVQVSQLAILMGGLGVGIGLGLQDVVKNFAAGITLLLERRLHVGDAVQIPDKNVFGRILSIGMRASVVRNWNGTEAIMPNDDLVAGTVTNWTLSDATYRLEVKVGVAYSADPASVIELLLSVARADERLLRDPAPVAFFTAFGDSSLDFVLRAWSDAPYETAAARQSDLAVAVHAALLAAGIAIPFPQRDVVMHVSPEVSDLLRSSQRSGDAG